MSSLTTQILDPNTANLIEVVNTRTGGRYLLGRTDYFFAGEIVIPGDYRSMLQTLEWAGYQITETGRFGLFCDRLGIDITGATDEDVAWFEAGHSASDLLALRQWRAAA